MADSSGVIGQTEMSSDFSLASIFRTTGSRLFQGSSTSTVSLSAPTNKELEEYKSEDKNNDGVADVVEREGVVRDVPEKEQQIKLQDIAWQEAPGNQFVGRIAVESAGAAAMRVKLDVDAQNEHLQVRYIGADGRASAPEAFSGVMRDQWSPTMTGSRMTIEIRSQSNFLPSSGHVAIAQIGHLFADTKDGATLRSNTQCISDAPCLFDDPALMQAQSAIGKISFKRGRNLYSCSGTLVGKTAQDRLFMTAAHCIVTEEEAATVTIEWHFQLAACNSTALDSRYTQTSGGAVIAGMASSADTVLLMLRRNVPEQIMPLQVASLPLAAGAQVHMLHHPEGELKKRTSGFTLSDEADYKTGEKESETKKGYAVRWTSGGIALPGSSGSPLLKFENNTYMVHGVNSSRNEHYSCTNPDFNIGLGPQSTFGSSAAAFGAIGYLLERRPGNYPVGGPLSRENEAQAMCPTVCESKGLLWGGEWKSTNTRNAVCACK